MNPLTISAILFFAVVVLGGLMAMSFRIPASSPDYNPNGGAVQNFDLAFGTQVAAADGAINIKEGTVFLTKGTAAAMTLAAPTAGAQSAGGDDGRRLTIIDTTGKVHTVTTPATKLNGTLATITFDNAGSPPTAKVGSLVTLIAYNGIWYSAAQYNVTLS